MLNISLLACLIQNIIWFTFKLNFQKKHCKFILKMFMKNYKKTINNFLFTVFQNIQVTSKNGFKCIYHILNNQWTLKSKKFC